MDELDNWEFDYDFDGEPMLRHTGCEYTSRIDVPGIPPVKALFKHQLWRSEPIICNYCEINIPQEMLDVLLLANEK